MQRIIKYLNYIIYWSIVLIPFSISIGPTVTYILMGFLFSSFLLKKTIKKERLFVNTPINLVFFFLIIISVISFKNSIDFKVSFHGITKLFQNVLLFLICAEEIKDKRHIGRIILFIILGASLASFDALWQIKFGKDFIRGHTPIMNIGLKRATAAFPNANVLGVYLSAISPLIIGLTLYYFKGIRKVIMIFVSILVTSGIILTFSRGTAVALYVSILFLSLIRKDRIILSLLIIFLLISPFIMPQNIKEWAKQVDYNPLVFMLNADRVSIYRNTLNMIKHHPVIGVGVNTFSQNYLRYKLPEPDDAKTGDTIYAHNNFLHITGEIGLLGLGIFIWLLFRLFRQNVHIYRNLRDKYHGIVSLSITACLIAFLINGLTETSLYYSRVAMIFWYLVGFSLSTDKFLYADKT